MATLLTKPVTREMPSVVMDGKCPCCGTKDEVGPQTFIVSLQPPTPTSPEGAILVRRRGERRGQRLTLRQLIETAYRWGVRVELKKKMG